MSRPGCSCSQCAPAELAVRGGDEVRCPRGHMAVKLRAGRDARGKYLEASCDEPGCGAKQRVRREGLW